MTPQTSRLLKLVGYPIFACFALVFGIYVTFPYERLRETIQLQLEEASGYDVEIGSLRPSMITGVVMEGIKLTSRVPKAAAGSDKPTVITVETARARISLLSLLIGKRSVTFTVEGFGGNLEGAVSQSSGHLSVAWTGENISLGQVGGPMLAKVVSLPVSGTLKTSGEISVEEIKAEKGDKVESKIEGKITLACIDCRFGDGKSKLTIPGDPFLSQGVTIPKPVRLGKLGGDIILANGQAKLEGFSGISKDLELSLEGAADLREPFMRSQLRAFLKFKFTEALKKDISMLELLEKSDKLTRAKTADGFYGVSLSGPLASPNTMLSKTPPLGFGSTPGGRPGMGRPRPPPGTSSGGGVASSRPPLRPPGRGAPAGFPPRPPGFPSGLPSASGRETPSLPSTATLPVVTPPAAGTPSGSNGSGGSGTNGNGKSNGAKPPPADEATAKPPAEKPVAPTAAADDAPAEPPAEKPEKPAPAPGDQPEAAPPAPTE